MQQDGTHNYKRYAEGTNRHHGPIVGDRRPGRQSGSSSRKSQTGDHE